MSLEAILVYSRIAQFIHEQHLFGSTKLAQMRGKDAVKDILRI